ncbi:hypothetical protein [Flavobacterium sp. U410]
MEYSAFESKLDLEQYIIKNFNYDVISKMTFDDYKKKVYHFFTELNKLKENGLKKGDIEDFLSNHYSSVIDVSDDDDILFERRFTIIIEELVEFCPAPFFWDIEFSDYKKKLDIYFESYWLKQVTPDSSSG